MKRTNFLYVALATMTLATSCAQDDLQSSQAAMSEISFHANMGLKSRATETDITKLGNSCFYVSAYNTGNNLYMTNVKYTKNTSNQWVSPAGEQYFWPVLGNLDIYAYAYGHKATQTPLTDVSATFTVSGTEHKIADFTPAKNTVETTKHYDASVQEDLIYACVSGSKSNTNGVDLVFKHALSEISIKATNSNTAYKVTVSGVKLGNIISKDTYTFPAATSGSAGTNTANYGTWGNASTTVSDKTDYETDLAQAIELTSSELYVDGSTNGEATEVLNPFMLIPQACKKGVKSDSDNSSQYSNGHYIALKVTISMKSGDTYNGDTYTGWAYVGLDTKWEEGKHYTYVLDFSKGAGQDENGNQIISGNDIIIKSVTVTEWTTESPTTNMTGLEGQGA